MKYDYVAYGLTYSLIYFLLLLSTLVFIIKPKRVYKKKKWYINYKYLKTVELYTYRYFIYLF